VEAGERAGREASPYCYLFSAIPVGRLKEGEGASARGIDRLRAAFGVRTSQKLAWPYVAISALGNPSEGVGKHQRKAKASRNTDAVQS
jgi:hypothetical protein